MFPANFLTADRISCQSAAASKKRVLEELGGLLAASAEGLVKATRGGWELKAVPD